MFFLHDSRCIPRLWDCSSGVTSVLFFPCNRFFSGDVSQIEEHQNKSMVRVHPPIVACVINININTSKHLKNHLTPETCLPQRHSFGHPDQTFCMGTFQSPPPPKKKRFFLLFLEACVGKKYFYYKPALLHC